MVKQDMKIKLKIEIDVDEEGIDIYEEEKIESPELKYAPVRPTPQIYQVKKHDKENS